jgi:GntR family transcriptional regulator / MocR family aminotransferase
LDWAQAQQAWIIEDDYDSEFRYDGRPLAALQGLDNARRVLYIGSFSKVMFPSLRLGYLVLPSNLVAAFRSLRGALDDHPSMLAQQALHDFFVEGHFAAHLRRMRRAYSLRRQAMVMALKADLPDYLEVASVQAGMHLVAFLRPSTGLRDVAVAAAAEQLGLSLIAISPLYRRQPARQGLLIGFAAAHETDIPALVSRLVAAIKAAAGAT